MLHVVAFGGAFAQPICAINIPKPRIAKTLTSEELYTVYGKEDKSAERFVDYACFVYDCVVFFQSQVDRGKQEIHVFFTKCRGF